MPTTEALSDQDFYVSFTILKIFTFLLQRRYKRPSKHVLDFESVKTTFRLDVARIQTCDAHFSVFPCASHMCATHGRQIMMQSVHHDVFRMLCYALTFLWCEWTTRPNHFAGVWQYLCIMWRLSCHFRNTNVNVIGHGICALFNSMLTVHIHSCSWSMAIIVCFAFPSVSFHEVQRYATRSFLDFL